MNTTLKAKILGTGSYLPERVVTNFDLEKIIDTNDEWIRTRTGVSERRFLDEKQTTSDLAVEAAKKAMEMAGVTAEELDLIIVATLTSDMIFPSTACVVQDKLGASKAAAFDVVAVCTGFLYGMITAEKFIISGMYKRVLVIGAEAMTRVIDPQDRGTSIIFGDGAGAVIMGPSEDESGILACELGADGSGGKYLNIPAGGAAMPASHETVDQRLHYVKMDGSEVFKFAVRTMNNSCMRVIEQAGLDLGDIDYFVPHQANIRIIDAAAKKLKLSMDKVHVNIDKVGNTSAASVPIALDEAVRQGKIKRGDIVLTVAFGGGLTWGSSIIKW